ncbi:MAG: N-acetylmuramoyl-L-alanine amidase [Saprospiraceae bacterium]|nr:N-acetylmuramoyl-L-alanine amidase [Saprospiraceae bacterium]
MQPSNHHFPNLRFFLLCGAVLCSLAAGAESVQHLKTKALPGDGILSLMRRYQLEQYSCNFAEFYKLNSLKKNAPLIVDREYTLPIRLFDFDGRTIRSSIGVNDWDRAVRIQQYNEKMVELGICPEVFRTSKILWVPHHLLHCPEADLVVTSPPPSAVPAIADPELSGGPRMFPIFGKDHAYVPLESSRLKGRVFYLISGHGGPDPGAMTTRSGKKICEDEYAYDVTLRLCRRLVAHGATAYMITRDLNDGIRSAELLPCDTDEEVWGGAKIPYGQKERLWQRTDIVNELFEKHTAQGVTAQTLIEIHVDSRSHGQRTDVYFYHHSSSDKGQALAAQLQQTLKTKYQQYRKGGDYHGSVTARDLHTLREAKPVSVYVELGNIRNYGDQQRIVLPSNRQLLAEWLFEGLTK